MIALTKPIDQGLFAGYVRIRKRRRRRRILGHFLHLFSQAQRPHISPNFPDVGQTFRLRADFPDILPPERIALVLGPYRVLFFMVYYNLVGSCVFSIRVAPTHFSSSLYKVLCVMRCEWIKSS